MLRLGVVWLWPTHRYGPNRALDPPVLGLSPACAISAGLVAALLGRPRPNKAATKPTDIGQARDNPISVGQGPGASDSGGSAVSVGLASSDGPARSVKKRTLRGPD